MEKLSSKCQNCGGELFYNPHKKCLSCKYCETTYFLPKQNDETVIVRQYDSSFHPNQLNEELTAYKCGGCGNVYYMSSDEKSKKCPNCGHNKVEIVSDSGYCADGIIPFEISKEEASNNMIAYLKTKPNVPASLIKLAKTQKMMGIFVPVWNFSFNINSSYSATVTELKKDSDGSYYGIKLPIFNEKISRVKSSDQCASEIEDDDLLELFDEKDYEKIIPYIPEYSFGYRVDSVTRDIHDYYFVATEKAINDEKKKIQNSIYSKYKGVSNVSIQSYTADSYFNFTYVPVYVNTFNYRGKNYKTYVSGITGKTIGKTPTSIWSIFKTIFKTIGFLALLGLIVYLLK